MKKYICTFSSDFRELYKADIYKVLAMPNDFIVHFRYKFKYIEQSILDSINKYLGKEVVIFHSINNTTTNIPENISVRMAKLVHAEKSDDTGLFHAYLQLGDFCNLTIDPNVAVEKTPLSKFFSHVECVKHSDNSNWFEKIEVFKKYFPDFIFYHIKSFKTVAGTTKKVKISKDKKGCFYRLNHGTKYLAELSIANPENSDCKLSFESSSDDISANMLNPIEVSAQFDDITIPIYLKSLNVSTESSFISFIPKNESKINSEYSLNIEIEKRIGVIRTISFGVYTLLAVFSIWIIKDNSESISNIGQWTWGINWKLIISSLTLLFSSSMLLSQLNKI